MQTTALKLYSLNFSQLKTYLVAAAFVIGNMLLPQLCHLVPQGGFIFLPIYFFTLIGAYKYGWQVGMMTAILSPLLNHIIFGMPPMPVLPAILTKSIFLAIAASVAAHCYQKISVPILFGVVLAYQVFGTLVEWALIGNFMKAIQDFRIGIPGMLIQVFGGYWLIHRFMRK